MNSPKIEDDQRFSLLNWIEKVGNKLPDPVTLFIIGAFVVLIGSEVAARVGWSAVHPTRLDPNGNPLTIQAKSLLSPAGARWVWLNLVNNFVNFPPLGVVLVAMIGIGIAERSGMIAAILKAMVAVMPQNLITPTILLTGVISSVALDAGYVVLPPLAAAIFMRTGRSPLVGIAVVFAGVAAGFSANLVITSLDPMLSGLTEEGARFLDPDYVVQPTCNLYFMIASTILITLVGWAVTRFIVEPRISQADIKEQIAAGASDEIDEQDHNLSVKETRGLIWGAIALMIMSVAVVYSVAKSGGTLNGFIAPNHEESSHLSSKQTKALEDDERETQLEGKFPVWVRAIVPILFVLFWVPGLVYGIATGSIKGDRDAAKMMGDTMSSLGPYIMLAFVAAQFIAWFRHSELGTLIALEGVAFIRRQNMPQWSLIVSIVCLTALLNLFIGSASAKWTLISPVFVPIFAGVGVSPELTQAAYRVGDSVTNSIAPLNPYMVIMLVFMQKYKPKAGLGSLISLMLPYSIVFFVVWVGMLLLWMSMGLPLGPGDPRLFIEPIEAVHP